jgi:hypothetical protein
MGAKVRKNAPLLRKIGGRFFHKYLGKGSAFSGGGVFSLFISG